MMPQFTAWPLIEVSFCVPPVGPLFLCARCAGGVDVRIATGGDAIEESPALSTLAEKGKDSESADTAGETNEVS